MVRLNAGKRAHVTPFYARLFVCRKLEHQIFTLFFFRVHFVIFTHLLSTACL